MELGKKNLLYIIIENKARLRELVPLFHPSLQQPVYLPVADVAV